MEILLAIDAGTTSIKAGVFSPDGRCLGLGRQEYQLETPAADRAQLDPGGVLAGLPEDRSSRT